jgi:serine/threonine protein kinase
MFTGKRPWGALKDESIVYKVFKDKEKPSIPTNINSEAKDFLKHCLEFDANLRWSASELLGHVFVKIAEDRF